MAIRDLMDKLVNWSGGAYVGLSTIVILGLAIAEYCNGAPVSIVGGDGKAVIYMVHRAPEWFTNSLGVYTIILGAFAISKPVNAYIAQKGNAGVTPPGDAK